MKHFFLLCTLLLLSSCAKQLNTIHPNFIAKSAISYTENNTVLFPILTIEEQAADWAKEYKIGLCFARDHDFYRAITCFKRASILVPTEIAERRLELHYQIVLCYYQSQKFLDVIYAFEKSDLQNVTSHFPAFYDLVTMLYDSYQQLQQKQKAVQLLEFIRQYDAAMADNLLLSSTIQNADLITLAQRAQTTEEEAVLAPLLQTYQRERKSPRTAQALNAVLPGAGYLYLGQKKSAATALLLNGAFIAAACRFLQRSHTAAALITLSFELGWYVGGINGAGLAAREYNERLYEKYGHRILEEEKLFPLFMLSFRF